MIKTKAIRDKAEESDGTRVLVTRYHPRGTKKEHYDKWFRELAPSKKTTRPLQKRVRDGSTIRGSIQG